MVTIKCIQRVLESKQSSFLKTCIKRSTESGRELEKKDNKFKTQITKLKNNAISGKSVQIK